MISISADTSENKCNSLANEIFEQNTNNVHEKRTCMFHPFQCCKGGKETKGLFSLYLYVLLTRCAQFKSLFIH